MKVSEHFGLKFLPRFMRGLHCLAFFPSLGDFLHSCGTRSQIHPCSKSIYSSPEINFALTFQRAKMAEQH